MSISRTIRSRLARLNNGCLWAGAATTVALSAPAVAQPQTDLVDPTGWAWLWNVPLQTAVDLVNDENQRVVDLEIEDDNPLRVSVATVTDAGVYDKAWWWYIGQTEADVWATLGANNARLIDIEPYETPSGLRFATVQIRNTGADQADSHGWFFGLTANALVNWASQNPGFRILDVQPYQDGGSLRYAIVVVRNSGNLASAWWYLVNVPFATIQTVMGDNNARMIDLEEQTNGNYSAVMVPNDGNAWWWVVNSSAQFLGDFAAQNGARIIDLQHRNTGSNRFWALLRRNDNDLAIDTNLAMRAITDGTSGFLLTEMDGPEFAGIQEWKIFEPASLLKTWYHASAMRSISIGNDALGNIMSVNEGLNGSCPDGTIPTNQTVQQALTDMMTVSSNADTEAIRQRYGQVWMDAVAGALGMNDTDTNHVIGCFCNSTRNEITLDDLASLYQTVNNGYLGAQANNFYNIMSNSLNTSQGGGLTFNQILTVELAASNLDVSEQADFLGQVFHASKGGSYNCNAGAANVGFFRSRGGIFRLPFRTGCRDRLREYSYGAWVNDASNGTNASTAVGTANQALFRDRLLAAIATWEASACGCPADLNGDGFLDNADINLFIALFLGGDLAADFNDDGILDNGDISEFIDQFLRGC